MKNKMIGVWVNIGGWKPLTILVNKKKSKKGFVRWERTRF